jgi:LysM repeat protein
MKYFQLIVYILFVSFYNYAQDNIEIDSNSYPWYSPSLNYLQFYSKNSLSSFYDALNNSKKNKVSIIHFGDSHIQSEIPTNETRILLQKKYGNGGRGLVFPYSTAKTYSSIHYSTKHAGNWTYTKSTKPAKDIPIGILGMTSKTSDSIASFTITFNAKIPSNNTLLKLFCENDSLSYDIIVETDGKSSTIDVFSNSVDYQNGVVTFTLPSISNTITFKCLKSQSYQNQFTLHGFELLNTENKGIIYYTSGVGGAKFNSLLTIDNFNSHLNRISPDLVVLDFGTNDFLYSDSIKPNLETDIKKIISLIRKTSPLVSIVLFSTQDLYYKQKNLNATAQYSELLKKIAKETEVAYWDWFSISGGKGSLKTWLNQGLAKNDMIHLSNIGYRIKGELFFEAIENTKKYFINQSLENELIITNAPRKIDVTHSDTLAKNLTTLSNRELTEVQKEKKDTISNVNFQKQIIIQDSTLSVTTTTFSDGIIIKDSISKPKNLSLINEKTTIKVDSIYTKNVDTTLINTPQINTHSNIDSTNLNQPKTTADIFRPKNDTSQNSTNNNNPSIESNQNKVQTNENKPTTKNTLKNKNIKVELFEDFNDSTLVIIENSKKTVQTTKNSKSTKKNYEIARERQHQILDHDTLAVKIVSDTISKPVVKPKAVAKPAKPKNIVYKVKSGDNLSYIAEKYNVKVSDIKTWNGLKNDNLSLGQTIIIKR